MFKKKPQFKWVKAYIDETIADKAVADFTEKSLEVEGIQTVAQCLSESANKKFETLELYGNNIGDEGTNILVDKILNCMPTIRTVNLEFNNITVYGVQKLCSFLRTNRNIENISLYSNTIGDDGAALIADMLQTNIGLQSLNLFGCGITDHGVALLAQAIQNKNTTIKSIELSNNPIATETYLDIIQALMERNKGDKFVVIPNFPTIQNTDVVVPKLDIPVTAGHRVEESISESPIVLPSPRHTPVPPSPLGTIPSSHGPLTARRQNLQIAKTQVPPKIDYYAKSVSESDWFSEKSQLMELVDQLTAQRKQLLILIGKDLDVAYKEPKMKVVVCPVPRVETGKERKEVIGSSATLPPEAQKIERRKSLARDLKTSNLSLAAVKDI